MTTVTTRPPATAAAVAEPMSHRQILEAMTGLLAALFTAMLSSTIVSVALPTIIGELHGTQRQFTWVITAALLATTVSAPIWGKLSDLFSKKLLVQIAIVVFVAGSIAAGFSQNVPFLLGARVLQGLGMGGLTALVQSIMGTIIAPRQRGRYSGYMGAVMAVSTVAGPLLGGLVVDSPLGWRWCFFVCIPLAVISLFILQANLHVPSIKRQPKIDYLGALLISGAASLPLLWVTFAGNDFAWVSWQTAAYFGSTAVLIVLVIIVELRVPEPLVPLRLLANRTATLVILASIAVGIGMFGGATFLGQYFQFAKGYTPTHAGLMTIPLMAGMLLSSTISGQIISRTGRWKKFLVVGAVLLTGGLVGLGTIDHTTAIWQLGVFMALMGMGMMMQNLVLAVQNTVDVRDIGATSATVAFFRSLGGAVGVSVLGAVLANEVQSKIATGLAGLGIPAGTGGGTSTLDFSNLPAPVLTVVRAVYGDATGTIFWIGAGAAAVALVAAVFIREVPLRTSVELQKPDAVSAATQTEHVDEPDGRGELPTAPALEPETSEVDLTTLDDPTERQAVAALDVLTAAQDQARQHLATARSSNGEVCDRIDLLGRAVDDAAARFHAELEQIKKGLLSDDTGPSLGRDGTGGDHLRAYEYGLQLNAQQTAEKVIDVARQEAERLLTTADDEVATVEQRVAKLREVEVEAELSSRLSETLRRQDLPGGSGQRGDWTGVSR